MITPSHLKCARQAVCLAALALSAVACSDDSPTDAGPTQDAALFRRIAVGDNTAATLRLYDASDFTLSQTITTAAPVS